jgi:flagellar motor switch protein FliM
MAGLDSEMQAATEEAPAEGTAAVATAAHKERKIKHYDFKRPDRFNKDQLRMIEMMHETFARHFGAAVSNHIRTIAEVKTTSVRQATYGEYITNLENPTAITVFSMEPLKGNCILELNPSIMFTLIDRILGGPGKAMAKQRELTDIEQVIVGKIAVKALDNLHDAWARVIAVKAEIKAKETNPQFVQLVAPNEMVLLIEFDITIKEQKGEMSLCFPYLTLEPVISKLSSRNWFATGLRHNDPTTRDHLKESLNQTAVPLIVKIGSSELTARELLKLKVGDVVTLNTGVNDDMEVFVENRKMFGGRPGVRSKKKAIMITRQYEALNEELRTPKTDSLPLEV